MMNLFNYNTSFLNPLLKLVVPLLFLWGGYYAYRAARRYSGEIRKLMWALVIVGAGGFFAGLFRYLADLITISWKWGESVGYLLFGVITLLAAWYAAGPLVRFIIEQFREVPPKAGVR